MRYTPRTPTPPDRRPRLRISLDPVPHPKGWLGQTLRRGVGIELGAALEHIDDDPSAAHAVEQAGADSIGLLRQYILKEDNVLFAIGDQVMTEDDQRTLARSFCEVGCRAFEGKRREELERLADALEARWSATS